MTHTLFLADADGLITLLIIGIGAVIGLLNKKNEASKNNSRPRDVQKITTPWDKKYQQAKNQRKQKRQAAPPQNTPLILPTELNASDLLQPQKVVKGKDKRGALIVDIDLNEGVEPVPQATVARPMAPTVDPYAIIEKEPRFSAPQSMPSHMKDSGMDDPNLKMEMPDSPWGEVAKKKVRKKKKADRKLGTLRDRHIHPKTEEAHTGRKKQQPLAGNWSGFMKNSSGLKQAVILMEVLAPPLAMRDTDFNSRVF